MDTINDTKITSHFGRRRSTRKLRRCGAAATEFAIVAPVFFLMVIGFIEIGRALMVQQVLINASRVGARMTSTTGSTTSGVETAVSDYTSSVAVPGVTVWDGFKVGWYKVTTGLALKLRGRP